MTDYPQHRSDIDRAGRIIRVRPIAAPEIRQLEGTEFEILGSGLEWGARADLGTFTESFQRGAFGDVLEGVRFKMGHDQRRVALAISPRTMSVSEGDTGLDYVARIDTRSPDAMALAVAAERGDVFGASISFDMFGMKEDRDYTIDHTGDRPHYEITNVRNLLEISGVDFPAYPSSDLRPRDDQDILSSTHIEGDTAAHREWADALLLTLPPHGV